MPLQGDGGPAGCKEPFLQLAEVAKPYNLAIGTAFSENGRVLVQPAAAGHNLLVMDLAAGSTSTIEWKLPQSIAGMLAYGAERLHYIIFA